MDPADAYIDLYDALVDCGQDDLSAWSTCEQTVALASEVCAVVIAEGNVPEEKWNSWLPNGPAGTGQALGVLLGLDRALLNANPAMDSLGCRALADLRSRLMIDGCLNDKNKNDRKDKGILLFRRATPCRPTIEPESLDEFLNLVRIPARLAKKVTVRFVREVDDLPDLEADGYAGDLRPLPRLPIAQLPMLAEPADLIWDRVEQPPRRYSVRPCSPALTQHVPQALTNLDASGAVLALLPEASLDDDLLATWREALRATPRPRASRLTWLLLGAGPVRTKGPAIHGPRPPNRAVILHRSGDLLLTQDKQRGFCLTEEQQREYGIDLGCKRGEYIKEGRITSVLEARHGRFAIHICEDLNRKDTQNAIIELGTTHLLVPVLAAAMWYDGWQAEAALKLAQESGTDVAVSNGLAVQRYYQGKPAPTLLACSVPSSREEYLSTKKLVSEVRLDSTPDDARTDALTPRTTDW